MIILASGPIHKERLTLPYCWALKHDESDPCPYIVHRKVWHEEHAFHYSDGYYFKDMNKAMLKWLEKVTNDIQRNTNDNLT